MSLGPLIVQSDRTVLLETDHPQAKDARHELAIFAELERAPEHIHTYRITRLGLWNARAAGHDAEFIIESLKRWSKYPVPEGVEREIRSTIDRYGKLVIDRDEIGLRLSGATPAILIEVASNRKISDLLDERLENAYRVKDWARGQLKQELLKLGWPAEDNAGFTPGTPFEISLDESLWQLRDYQREAVNKFELGGSGVVVLPCGAGKTIVGAAAMAHAKATTLILVTNTVAARQWRDELLKRTSLNEDEIGEYSGAKKEIRPVTIATYQVMTKKKNGVYAHLDLFDSYDWGLIIYDEVHLLPAPIFRFTADIQSRRRLGLTATLVREDGMEGEVFSLIGPKRFDVPWKEIEAQGYIAPAECIEVRVNLTETERLAYATAEPENRYRNCATTRTKRDVVEVLVEKHADDQVLVIGQYIDQLDELSEVLGAPLIKGETPIKEREILFNQFRSGEIKCLVVSKVANFSIDLPDATIAIQVSGAFGSRQEEAQRLGRILRPKSDGRGAKFYSVISRDTIDQDFAQNRQRFLAEQGYSYKIIDADDVFQGKI